MIVLTIVLVMTTIAPTPARGGIAALTRAAPAAIDRIGIGPLNIGGEVGSNSWRKCSDASFGVRPKSVRTGTNLPVKSQNCSDKRQKYRKIAKEIAKKIIWGGQVPKCATGGHKGVLRYPGVDIRGRG